MKKLILRCLFAITIVSACKKEQVVTSETNTIPRGALKVSAQNIINGVNLQLGQMVYTNNAGNTFRLDALKYYLSNFEIVDTSGASHKFGNYELIDHSKSESKLFTLDSIPRGTYNKLKFFVGVDSITNQTLNNPGDLDISYGMFWSWSTGYIFLKAEGAFIDSTGAEKPLIYHLGSNVALSRVEIDFAPITIDKITKNMNIKLDINKMFGVTEPLDFNFYNVQQSFPTGEERWIESMRTNLPTSFSLEFVQ
jgi:hypothetical protein